MNNKSSAVVTGATGMIGLAIIRKLVAENYFVYAVVNPKSGRISNVPVDENVKIIKCSLEDMDKLPQLIGEKCKLFFHLAWSATYGADPRNDMLAQTENIRNCIKACESAYSLGCEVFVGAGSQAEYGRQEQKLSPDLRENPENGYGMAKLCAGKMTRIICQKHNMRHIWCRILSVYGPYDNAHSMIMGSIIKMLNGESPKFTKGEQLWDYIYCDDAANGIYLAAVKGKSGSIYCVGSGQAQPMSDYILAVRDAVNPDLPVTFGGIPYFENQVMYLCADISSLSEDTGFKPIYTFEEGIAKTVEWRKKISVSE